MSVVVTKTVAGSVGCVVNTVDGHQLAVGSSLLLLLRVNCVERLTRQLIDTCEMIGIEIIERATLGIVLQTTDDVVVVWQLDDLVGIERSVETEVPKQTVTFEDINVGSELKSLVADGTDVTVDRHIVVVIVVREGAAGQRQLHSKEQVFVATVVVAQREVNTVEQTAFQSHVDGLGSLPLDVVGSKFLLHQRSFATVLVNIVKCLIAIETHTGIVTHLTVRCTEAQVVDPRDILHEGFLLHIPVATKAEEVTPTVVGVET